MKKFIIPRLDEQDSLWLKHLSNKLDMSGMSKIITEGRKKTKGAYMKAYMYILFQANPELLKELMNMQQQL